MKIANADCFSYSIPLVSPLKLGGLSVTAREGLLLRLTDNDGAVGWGEAAPLPGFSKESLSEARGQCIRLARELTDVEFDIAAYFNDADMFSFGHQSLCRSVQFALESALAELWSSSTGKPIAELFGVCSRDYVLVNGLLAGDDETIMAQAFEIADRQFLAIKIKIGDRTPEQADKLISRVTKILPSSAALRLDNNRQWNLSTAMRFASLMNDSDCLSLIEQIEEPVDNREDLKKYISESNLPIALDETIPEISPGMLGEYGGAVAVVLKPSLLGGLRQTVAFARTAKSLGMKIILSSSFESDLAVATLARFVSVVCDKETPCGFDTLKWFASSLLANPPVIINGRITCNSEQCGEMVVNERKIQKIRKITDA